MAETKEKKRVQDELSITEFRRKIHSDIKENTIRPVTYDGELRGVFISIGERDDLPKAALLDLLKFNPRAAVGQMIEE